MTTPFVRSLPPVPRAASEVRQCLRDRCGDLPVPLLETAMLVASELVNNAIRHGEGRVTVRFWPRPDGLRMEVTDSGPRGPEPTRPDADDESGRGLLIVDALASRWGSEPVEAGPGKTVWFELDAQSDDPPSDVRQAE